MNELDTNQKNQYHFIKKKIGSDLKVPTVKNGDFTNKILNLVKK